MVCLKVIDRSSATTTFPTGRACIRPTHLAPNKNPSPTKTTCSMGFVINTFWQKTYGRLCILFVVELDEEVRQISSTLEKYLKIRAEQFHFVNVLNHKLGMVILVSYISDIVAASGMLAVLFTNEEPSHYWFSAKLIGALVFVTYCTLMYLPMVAATECVSNYYSKCLTNGAYGVGFTGTGNTGSPFPDHCQVLQHVYFRNRMMLFMFARN